MIAERLHRLAEEFGLLLVLQFGSTATGRARPDSDLDIGVLAGRRDLALEEELELQAALQRGAGDRQVDLVVLDRADPLLLGQVARDARLLWGDPQRYYAWKMYAYRRYQDHRPYLAMERAYIRRELEARR